MLLFDPSFWNAPQVLPLVVVPKNKFRKSHIKSYQLEAIQFFIFSNQPQSQYENTKRNAILFVSSFPHTQLRFSQQALWSCAKLYSLWDCYIDENFEVGPQGISRLFQGWGYYEDLFLILPLWWVYWKWKGSKLFLVPRAWQFLVPF